VLSASYINMRDVQEKLSVLGVREPPANALDPFDTQRCNKTWKQDVVERQECMILGMGGVGCSVALALARIGVKRIVCVDNQTVAVGHLNRQVLYDKTQVGRKKAEASAESLKRHVIGNTDVVGIGVDLIVNWDRVVSIARKSTVIFNCVDINRVADFALASLAKSIGIPYIAATAYAFNLQVEAFSGTVDAYTQALVVPKASSLQQVYGALHPSVIQRYPSIDSIVFAQQLPAFDVRNTGSSALITLSAGTLAVTAFIQMLFGLHIPNFNQMNIDGFWKDGEIVSATAPPIELLPLPDATDN